MVAGLAMFLFYYHFTLAYTNNRGQKRIILMSYLLLLVAAALAPIDLLVEKIRLEDYGYAPILGPLGYPAMLGLLFWMGAGAYNLLRGYHTSSSYEERNRLLYLTTAALFPPLGALLDAFPGLPPAGIWGNLTCGIICSVAIVRYHLLDIRIIVRKSLAFLLISSAIAIPYVGTLYFVHSIFELNVEPWWVNVPVILLLAIVLRPLYSWAQQFVDKLFYRERYDYLRALQQFARETQSVVDSGELGPTLVKLVSGAVRSSSTCLLLSSKGSDDLAVASYVGLDDPPSGVALRGDSRLVRWLKLDGHILSSRELSLIPELQSHALIEKENLEKMRAELYVPIRARERQLSGMLILGQKLSQQGYSTEDRQLLSTLAGQMAVTFENVRLYSDALQARANLEAWLNSMSDCVMIVHTDYTIRFTNKATTERFGIRDGQVCWESLGKDARCSDCPMEYYFRGGREGQHYYKSIRHSEYDVATAPLFDPDGSLAVVEVLRDITERKQAEEKEKQLQQELYLSSRLASIGRLAAGVAHEINNPLTGILGFSQRLLRKSTDETERRDLERINNEARRAAKVVENLLTFARRHETKKQHSDINEILQKALELRAYELKTSNIEVATDLAASLPQTIVDFQQIQQVFLNIILNAEQAMTEAKGEGRLRVKTEQMKSYVRVSFADSGPGIAAEDLNKLFDPFFTTRTERGGTGLGLGICHGIVVEHGGRIYAKSKPGKGAIFFVELPLTTEKIDEGKVLEKEPIGRSK